MDSPVRTQYYLTPKTFICLTDGTLVFLDLQNDKYSCLESKYTEPVTRLLGLTVPTDTLPDAEKRSSIDIPPMGEEEVPEVIQDLITNGLVTRHQHMGKPAELLQLQKNLREMPGFDIGTSPKIRAHHLFHFFKALIIVKSMLRFASMERIIERVRRRREKFEKNFGPPDDPASKEINEAVEIYKILKPLFVTVKDQCLFNAFFLIEFLACYRIFPHWYFGVKLNEFTAHCWVQGGNFIYDDTILNTYRHKSIMAA